ncbi:MAG: formylglycine-generating enzyme family protein, partial [Planctomycetota bacterium]|nr:formylglycine-generating enzyme family protein [Planctomycetota bacterium]
MCAFHKYTALACTLLALLFLAVDGRAQQKSANPVDRLGFNPTAVPTLDWLPKPTSVPDAAAEKAEQMKPYSEKLAERISFDMVPIAGGRFLMGSSDAEADRSKDEGPRRQVAVDPFWIGRCEVTWDEFNLWAQGLDEKIRRKQRPNSPLARAELLADAVSRPSSPFTDMTYGMGSKGRPASGMTQFAAKCYCKWLSAKTGRYYRLPTEAQWEYAARAGTTTAYSFGDSADDIDQHAWYFDNADDKYQPVGGKKPNPWGLHDMHGNVMEWVLDQYAPYDKANLALSNPLVPTRTEFPVVARGGCWDDDPQRLRSAARRASAAEWKSEDPRSPQSIWYLTEPW